MAFLGARKGTKSQIIFLAVIAATWLFIGVAGPGLAVWVMSLLRGGLRGETVHATGLTPQPDLLPPQEVSLINTIFFSGILIVAYLLIWRTLPTTSGLASALSGGVFGAVNGMLISLYLFRLSPQSSPQTSLPPDSVSPLRLQTPAETIQAGLPPLVVLGILLVIFLAVRAIQRPPHGSGMGPFESQ